MTFICVDLFMRLEQYFCPGLSEIAKIKEVCLEAYPHVLNKILLIRPGRSVLK